MRIEYTVRVLIGPADIRFELWFDDQKLSRDESIKVEWIPAGPAGTPPIPQIAEMPASSREPVEMSITPPTPIDAAPPNGAFHGAPNGKTMKTGGYTVVNKKAPVDMGGKKSRGLFGKSSFFGRAA